MDKAIVLYGPNTEEYVVSRMEELKKIKDEDAV